MRRMFLIIGEILDLLGPALPGQWNRLAKHLASGPGWVPSMMLCATFGVTVCVNSLTNRWINGLVADVINVATWTSWAVVCCFAMLIAIRRSARNVFRMGAFAVTRARWWFECATTAWNIVVLLFLVTLVVSWAAVWLQAQGVGAIVWQGGRLLNSIGLATFAIAGTAGYGVSFARRRWPTGRASECVHYFLLLPAGFMCVIVAVDHWPIGRLWPDGFILVAGAVGALLFLGIAIVAGSKGFERFWRRSAANAAQAAKVS